MISAAPPWIRQGWMVGQVLWSSTWMGRFLERFSSDGECWMNMNLPSLRMKAGRGSVGM